MSILKNAKHEKFAHLLFGGMADGKAYIEAGYDANPGNASRLKNNEKIQARVRELKLAAEERAVHSAALTKEWVIDQFKEAYRVGMELEQISAAVGALKCLGAEAGMFTERGKVEQEVSYVVSAVMDDDRTPSDWSDRFTAPKKPNGANGHA